MCLPYSVEELRRTVAELNLSHQQLARAQEALVQSEKLASMGQLAAGIAHEINNPLGVVLMYAHLLAEEAPPGAPGREDLELIAAEADRCKKIVAGLLHFARQNRVVREPVEVEALVRETLRALPAPENVAVAVDCRLADPQAELDRDQIAQVLTNLAANACAAMPAGGELKVEIAGDADEVVLRVRDTGVGIPPENMEKIFHPFFTTKPLGQGTGLGLAITYGIVKMHRGNITCQSNANPGAGPTGTTFTITLPRREEGGESLG
jgi:signal transduction histidine kinase